MNRSSKRLLPLLVLVLCGIVAVRMLGTKESEPRNNPPPAPQEASPSLLALLPARQATPGIPLHSWERLLVEGGTPAEDRASLADIVTNYLQSSAHDSRPPLGTNEEITRALSDPAVLGDAAIPMSHPAIVSGQLIDRWGSPWFFHQLSADVFEVRSFGPDRKPFTADDVVK